MIRNFFRTLTDQAVEYLLISGQASVLYGAATFSEDIDLWINPTPENLDRFISAMRACRGRYYKLTPVVTVDHLRRGHGFHFFLPAADEPEIFLDVMGAPPRIGPFASASAAATWMDTEWGQLHVIGLKHLVELKRTQRLEDYPVISKLALAWLDQPGCTHGAPDLLWAVDNIYTLPELRLFFREHPVAEELSGADLPIDIREFGRQVLATGEASEELEQRVANRMQQRITEHQQADRAYWRSIIVELKSLRQAGQLMTEGDPV